MTSTSNQRFRSRTFEKEIHRPCERPHHHYQHTSINYKSNPVVIKPFSAVIDGYKIHPDDKENIQGGDQPIEPSPQIMVATKDLCHDKYQHVRDGHTYHYHVKKRFIADRYACIPFVLDHYQLRKAGIYIQ